MEAMEICNKIAMEVEGLTEKDFPLDAFPTAVQSVILDWKREENFKVEYTAAAMLSATSVALGNTCRIRVRGQWQCNAALYIILVGRPGLGKTPPLSLTFAPIRKRDKDNLISFKTAMEAYRQSKGQENGEKEPVLVKTVISDFTPEAMMARHNDNPRGIVILVDEIMGMFNTANRYNNSQLIEQLLTAWSGEALDVTRMSNPIPIHIEQPCINIIGTTQTRRVNELLKKGYEENGLLDRIMFVLPSSQKICRWTDEDGAVNRSSTATSQWHIIIERLLSLDYDTDTHTGLPIPQLINFDSEARACFYDWWNSRIEKANAKENDADVESRMMKDNTKVARLALIMQALRYACGEASLQCVDMHAVKSAIRVNDYFENAYRRLRAIVASEQCDEPSKEMLSLLAGTFTTSEALAAGARMRISERTVYNYINQLEKSKLIRCERKGTYTKTAACNG